MAPTTGRKKKKRKKECNEANFKEPKIKWKKSDAKRLLCKDIMEGLLVPLEVSDNNGHSMMPLSDIYVM
jgi:hypothetical protein